MTRAEKSGGLLIAVSAVAAYLLYKYVFGNTAQTATLSNAAAAQALAAGNQVFSDAVLGGAPMAQATLVYNTTGTVNTPAN